MAYKFENCADGDADYIIDRLVVYNLSQVPAEQETLFDTLDKKITDENGKIIAGCVARMYCWKVAYIDTLWVDEKYRDKGLGSKLLAEVEKSAKEKGCYLIHLDTFDFQAKEFYEKQGYSLFGTLEDCPKSHCRFYLKKLI
ncbi:N-acetylglutamate synthase, GNAT family [Ruminococcaceae bacterium P7]|nr:N-acetylglutamate synthase, GNAT family [Ruminococcaceae bacterium P7]